MKSEHLHPNTPQNVKSSALTASSVTISWDAAPGAKSYVIHHDLGTGIPTDAIYMHYTEGNSFTLNDANFKGTLAGLTINFYIQSFNETFEGATEVDQARNAHDNGFGSAWSTPIKVTFPAAKKAKK